jgi:hypothetical protein
MRRILTFEFVQNNNNARSGFTSAKKRIRMVSNMLKRWRDDFSTVKKAEGWFRGFSKRNGMPSRLIPLHLKHWIFQIPKKMEPREK